MLKKFGLDEITRIIVAVGVMLLVAQVLRAVLQHGDLLSSVLILMLSFLAAVVYYFFPRERERR